MTKIDYIWPMKKSSRILLLIYDGFELLDMSGPASVFAAANSIAQKKIYDIKAVSPQGGNIHSSSGLCVNSIAIDKISPQKTDTVLVVGAQSENISLAMEDDKLIEWISRMGKVTKRYGSICSGAFIIAAAGLLNNRKSTTHWASCKKLSDAFPYTTVQSNALYVIDPPLWTSAGVTTGIDMTLTMVKHDLGAPLMQLVAKWLVVYSHRPGNQSQFSNMLLAQSAADGIFTNVIEWMDNNLAQSIRLEDMAYHANMSERTFRRKFVKYIGESPAKFLEMLRLDKAKALLEANVSVGSVTTKVGFKSEAGFRTAFQKSFGVSPSLYAALHARG